MKKLFLLLAPLTLGLMVGCSYDDSAILDKIAEMEKEHDEMQAQIDAQQKLLDALANNLTITDVTQTSNGYTITLSDGTSMTIKDGEPGDNFIESIVVGEEDVTFTLTDGTVIVIPLGCSSSGSGDTPVEDNKIYYTTSDNAKLFPKTDASLYGAILISNTYKDGQGVLVFDDAITIIGESAFEDCRNLTSVTIPDSVTTIGNYAFSGCRSLTSITIPDSLTTIGEWAFCGCSLTSVTIPDSVTTIGGYAFYICSSLTSVTIGDSVTTIGGYAFYDCSSLTSVTIGDSVTTIGWYAFWYCSSLTSVYISDVAAWCNISFGLFSNPLSNGCNLYLNNELVTDLTIPDSVTEIGYDVFSGCSSLASVTIGDSVTTIGRSAFYGCDSLISVTIGDSVTTVGSSAFSGCSSLTELKGNFVSDDGRCLIFDGVLSYFLPTGLTEYTISDSVTTIGETAFYGCESLTSVTIPNSVTTIGDYAFYYCSSLISVTIPDSVTTIGESAFDNCSNLTSVTIGDSVTTIGYCAFYDCSSLTSVYCKPTTPPVALFYEGYWEAFNYNASGRKIYVPMESVEAYKSAEYWSEYADDIEGYDF